jgi:hypothetical protein
LIVDDDHKTVGHAGMMNKDSGMAKKEESTAPDDMHKDHVMPSSLSLTGRSDLKKYAGQKVAVTGSVSKESTSGTRRRGHADRSLAQGRRESVLVRTAIAPVRREASRAGSNLRGV